MAAANDSQAAGPPQFTEADKATARQWFEKARKLVDTRSYDYAIECYINGLERWPEAVEEGHKPLYAAAMFRAASGGKKPGTMDSFKYPVNCKDPRKAMLNAEFLLAKDPKNPQYAEAVFKNAVRAQLDETAMWVGPLFFDAAAAEKKPSAARFRLLVDLYHEISERQTARGNLDRAKEALERAIDAILRLRQIDTKNLELGKEQTDLATKLTILKGKYQTATTFRESVQDVDSQRDLHDAERLVQDDARLNELIDKARRELAESPDVAGKVFRLVDLLCKREADDCENEAIETLLAAYRKSGNYQFKLRADDIRIRQANRKRRAAKASGDAEAAKRLGREQLKLELGIFHERVKQYPTDLRWRFEYGKRLFAARDFDHAIPVFQEARNDPKVRTQCGLFIGRCFYERGYHEQAIDVLTQAIGGYEMQGDDVSRDMHYWLGRAHEAAGHAAEALKVYGQLLTWDYNYRDVRERVDKLRQNR